MNQKEHNLQVQVFRWANSGYMLDKHPELAYMFAIPNGGHRDVRTAARLKAEGVKAGVPDVFLPAPRGGYCGLFIEHKADKNKPSDNQERYLNFLSSQGYLCAVSWSLEETQGLILAYMGNLLLGGAGMPKLQISQQEVIRGWD